MKAMYFKGAHCCILVYDVSNPETFDHVKDWHSEMTKGASFPVTPILVVANKIDVPEEKRKVSFQDADAWCEELNVSRGHTHILFTNAFSHTDHAHTHLSAPHVHSHSHKHNHATHAHPQ